MLEIVPFVFGPVSTNCYLVADTDSGEAAVIDPAWDGLVILEEAQKRGWRIGQLWYTHAHFDHFGGAEAIAEALNPPPSIALHPLDHDLWKKQGGALLFGMHIDPGPEPTVILAEGQILHLDGVTFEVRHTPGHSPGHCVFYCAQANVLFSGDLIFQGGVGRTDLPGGDWETLVESIRKRVFTLPNETRILSGHGEESTVGEEKGKNPFVRALEL
jgi:glyoxylase-like metal-dependent hydrolase (beta-lactamase superfamily II)